MPNRQHLTFYDVLGVPMDASDADIKAAYKSRLTRCHPATCKLADNDSFCFLTEEERKESETVVKVLQKAYYVLSTPKLRAWYDEQLLGHYSAARRRRLQQQQQQQHGQQQPHTPPTQPFSLTQSLSTRGAQAALTSADTASSPSTVRREEATANSANPSRFESREAREEVREYTTPEGGHVQVVTRTSADPRSGAVYACESISYTTVPTATSTAASPGGSESPRPTPTEAAKADTTTNAASATRTATASGLKSPSPLIQDFDPAFLALLPERVQLLLSQLLTAPLPMPE